MSYSKEHYTELQAQEMQQNTSDLSLITPDSNGKVKARNLYKYLELEVNQISRWLKSKIQNNQFAVEGEDWVGFDNYVEGNKITDYHLAPNFAKKLCMMSKSVNGENARNYFLKCEELAKQKLLPIHQIQKSKLDLLKESNQNLSLAIEEIEEKEKIIAKQNLELIHKQEIILDLTADIPPKEMRATINEVIRWKAGDYGGRWNKLYKQFKYHYSVDIPTRAEHRNVKKLDYAQQENLLTNLYKLALELFEKDNPEIKNQLQLATI